MTQEYWYLSRAAGFTAYLLLFVSVALGIAIGTRFAQRFARRNTIFDLHRFTTSLALAFTLFHVFVLLVDGYFNFTVWQLIVPFRSPYRTWQTAVGVFALYTTALLIASFYVRRFIGYRAWRVIHFLTFALFAGATLHGITAGTDTTEAWAKLLYIATATATLGLIIYRVQYRIPDTSTMRAIRLAAGVAAVMVVALLMFATGLFGRPGARASQADLSTSASDAAENSAHPFLASFDTNFSGSYAQTRDAFGSRLVIDGLTDGDVTARIHVVLVQTSIVATPDNEASEQLTDDESAEASPRSTVTTNTAELRDSGTDALLCAGALTSMDNGSWKATCNGTGAYDGVRISVASHLQASSDGTFSGALSGSMRRLS